MRVLFVNHTGLVSGAEHSLLTLIDGMPSEMVAGLACPAGPLADMARERGIDVHPVRGTAGSLRLHPWHTPVAVTEMVLSGAQVARAARRSGATIVHANSLRGVLITVASPSLNTVARELRELADHLIEIPAEKLGRMLQARALGQPQES